MEKDCVMVEKKILEGKSVCKGTDIGYRQEQKSLKIERCLKVQRYWLQVGTKSLEIERCLKVQRYWLQVGTKNARDCTVFESATIWVRQEQKPLKIERV